MGLLIPFFFICVISVQSESIGRCAQLRADGSAAWTLEFAAVSRNANRFTPAGFTSNNQYGRIHCKVYCCVCVHVCQGVSIGLYIRVCFKDVDVRQWANLEKNESYHFRPTAAHNYLTCTRLGLNLSFPALARATYPHPMGIGCPESCRGRRMKNLYLYLCFMWFCQTKRGKRRSSEGFW